MEIAELITPTSTNHTRSLCIAALKRYSLPMNPAVGGMPVKDTRATVSTRAMRGNLRPTPAKLLISSLPVRTVMAVTAKKAARLVNA